VSGNKWIYIPIVASSGFTNTYSCSLDGIDERINFGNVLDETGTNPVTFSAWVKTSDADAGIFSKGAAAAGSGIIYMFVIAGGKLYMWFASGSGNYFYAVSNASVNTGAWIHLAAVYDGSNEENGITLYINGSSTAVTRGSSGTFTSSTNAGNFYVGFHEAVSPRWMNGVIGDLVILPWAANTAIITELYNGSSELDMTTFSEWNTMKADVRSMWVTWEADDLTGGTGSVTDLTDNGYVGTPTNTEVGDKVADSP